MSTTFPVAAQPREERFRAHGAIVNVIPTWKTTCFVIEPEHAGADATSVVKTAWALLALLQARGIPHNLLVVSNVVFVFPRKEQRENGVGLFSDDSSTDGSVVHAGRLRVAVAEALRTRHCWRPGGARQPHGGNVRHYLAKRSFSSLGEYLTSSST